jgi:cytochrome c oxidase subunit 3/cytochrome o ubiquinol oxidase subunit 3
LATAVAEHHVDHHYTSTGLPHTKIAIWAFIGSECFFFASLISTYLIYKGRSIVGPFPHTAWTDPSTGQHFHPILNIPVTSTSTFVLLMSSLAMVLAHAAVERSDHKWSRIWLLTTAALGATFLGFQAYEFTSFVHEGLKVTTNLFGSTFFITTGFHGAHVTVGVLWLITMYFIDKKRGLGPRDAVNVDVMALYWHFVDVVWVAIFTFLYLLQ